MPRQVKEGRKIMKNIIITPTKNDNIVTVKIGNDTGRAYRFSKGWIVFCHSRGGDHWNGIELLAIHKELNTLFK